MYLGGGTPRNLAPDALAALLAPIPGRPWAEATLEAAPGNITRATGAAPGPPPESTASSLGVQSFVDREIRRTGRKHSAEIVADEIAILRDAGICDINIDLIAGLSGQTAASWRESLDWIERLAPEHVSVYMLEVDEDSRLGKEMLLGGVRYGAADTPSEDATADFYETAVERLAAHRHRALRDLQLRAARLRIAPQPEVLAAASRTSASAPTRTPSTAAMRRQNPESVSDYLAGASAPVGGPPHLTDERLFVGLRLADGVRPSADEWQRFDAPIHRFVDAGLLEADDGVLRLTQPRRDALQRSVSGVSGLMIDLRSDTVTKPTPAMRQAMFEAEVGDDVYREDPTVNRLEERAAEIAGKEAALFVPTGTMGNTIAIKLLTEHGQEVICDSRAHLLDYELSMMAWFSGCVVRAIPTERGLLSWDEVRRTIRRRARTGAPTGAIAVEQTHNMAGGTVYPMRTLCEICDGAHERGIRVHMDGARIFNAARPLWAFPCMRLRPRRYGHVLSFQSTGRARRFHARRTGGADRQRPPVPQAPGRRNAAGGHSGGGGFGGAGRVTRQAG